MISHALLVTLKAQAARIAETEGLLHNMLPLLDDEPATSAWFGLRFGRGKYAIFDAFASEGGRLAHLEGAGASMLVGQAPALLDEPPDIQAVEILASKLPASFAPGSISCGLLLQMTALEGHEAKVEQLLRDAQPIVMNEDGTTSWFALKLRDERRYAILDFFPDHKARFAHLTGGVPRELTRHALSLMGGMPSVDMLDVLAAHRAMRSTEVGLGVD